LVKSPDNSADDAVAPVAGVTAEVHSELLAALSAVLHPQGIRFKFSIQELPEPPHKRLWVRCESSKSIDYNLLAAPLALRLRGLELEGFRDGIIRCVNPGMKDTDWRLKIDLKPPIAILEGWARWGDMQAITMLTNLMLEDVGLQVAGMLKNWRLHLFCCTRTDVYSEKFFHRPEGSKFPNKAQAIDRIVPLLHRLIPQGIQGATIYGVQEMPSGIPSEEESPLWVHWLDLPAATEPSYMAPPLVLAEQGNLDALTFVLQRLLNPDLEQCFAEGAIDISLLTKGNVLHVMSEAPVCPLQSQIVDPTVKVLRQLSLPGITGVRIYGRISGQQLPGWSYGSEFRRATTRLYAQADPTQRTAFTTPAEPTHWRDRLLAQDWFRSAAVAPGVGEFLDWRSVLPWAAVGCLLVGGLDLTGRGLASQLKQTNRMAAVRIDRPSFNNGPLDEKLVAYRQFCASGSPDVLIVGSSRAMRGVDPHVLRQELAKKGYPNARIYNLGINGATAQVVDLMLRRLIEPTQLPKLVIWADGARAFNDGRPDRTFNGLTASAGYRQLANGGTTMTTAQPLVIDGYDKIDRFLNRVLSKFSGTYGQRDRLKARLQELTPGWQSATSHSSSMPTAGEVDRIDSSGFLPVSATFDPATYYQSYAKVNGDSDGDYTSFTLTGSQDLATRQTASFLKQQKIPLIFVNVPLSDRYLDPVRQGHEFTFKQYMQGLAQAEQLQFIDLVGSWMQDYSFYSDPSHLNRQGAVQVSTYLVHNAPIDWQMIANPANPK
jgi:hypothetical protein